ncbi:monovalent cation/H+ antiporter complex subunit F [Nitrincola sp. MINF-07-Sa-05]|uniref:monovalent cation/H+ antiporter complex subunit F n=1 Tax=Nitrincola salilacus TaxID=3400273 RepID=UPI0039183167
MNNLYILCIILLLITLLVGLIRVWHGPRSADRILSAQLFGTTGVAILLLLAELQSLPAARDAALVLSLLAALASVAFVSRVWSNARHQPQEPEHEPSD